MRWKQYHVMALMMFIAALACNLPGQGPTATSTASGDGILPELSTGTIPLAPLNRTPLPTIDIGTAVPPGSNLVPFVIVPSASKITYEVEQINLAQGNISSQAAGSTTQVSGAVLIDFADPRNSKITTITVDISRFTSDSAQRDQAIRDDWLQSRAYPLAIFVPKDIAGLPGSDPDQTLVTFTVSGDLTLHGMTAPITFNVSAKVEDEFLNGTATGNLSLTDFGVDPPFIPGQWQSGNEVTIRFVFEAKAEKG